MDLLIPLQASFGDRLVSERVRFWIFLGLAILTFVVVVLTIKKARLPIAIISSFGAGWFGWIIYNLVTGSKTKLFDWQPKISSLPDVFSASSIVPGILLLLVFGATLGTWLASKKSNDNADVAVPFRVLATVGVFFGGLLILQPLAEFFELIGNRISG